MFAADILRDAWRSIQRQRGFVGLAVVAFALAMALNVTVYAILDALIAPKINIEQPERLYAPSYFETPWGKDGGPDLRPALQSATSFDAVTVYSFGGHATVFRGRTFHSTMVSDVAPNFFDVLRPIPRAGRVFSERDLGMEATPVVITEAVRNVLFEIGEDPIGQSVGIGRESGVVVGVLDGASAFPLGAGVIRPQASAASSRGGLLVRIKPEVSLEEAYRELDLIRLRIAAERGKAPQDTRVILNRVMERQFRVKNFHYALIGSVFAVLLVAALNVANLQLARGLNRKRELTTRAALGASRSSLVALLVAETTLVAFAGVVLGLLLAAWGMQIVTATVPPSVAQYIITPQWSWRVLAASAFAGVALIVIAGVIPAIRVSNTHLGDVLRSGPGTGVTRGSKLVSGGLVVAQVGLALALCIGGTLLARTAARVFLFDSGVDLNRLVAGWRTYPVRPNQTPLEAAEADLAGMRLVPGVVDAAAVYGRGSHVEAAIVVETGDGQQREIPLGNLSYFKSVTPTWFRTLGVPVAQGRDFHEFGETEPAVIVNDVAAREWWPNGDAAGRMVKLGSARSNARWVRVVGVHGPWLESVSQDIDPSPRMYYTHAGDTATRSACVNLNMKTGCIEYGWEFNVRTTRDPVPTAIVIRDRDPLNTRADTYDRAKGFAAQRQRYSFIASMFTTFAVLGLALAALGVYAVSAHAVAQRRREFGVRLALGATPKTILAGVLRDANTLGLLGIGLGLVVAAWTVGLLKAFLAGMEPMEPALFGCVALILLGVLLLATLPPALRAAATDPVESLRNV